MLHIARLTTVHFVVPILLLVLMPLPVRGSDAKGNYVALGFGLESCQTFFQARSNSLDLPYRHWLIGYLTAVNKLTRLILDSRVVIGQVWCNMLFLQVSLGGRDRCGIFEKSRLISN